MSMQSTTVVFVQNVNMSLSIGDAISINGLPYQVLDVNSNGVLVARIDPLADLFSGDYSWLPIHPWLHSLRDHAKMLAGEIKIPHSHCKECREAKLQRSRYTTSNYQYTAPKKGMRQKKGDKPHVPFWKGVESFKRTREVIHDQRAAQ